MQALRMYASNVGPQHVTYRDTHYSGNTMALDMPLLAFSLQSYQTFGYSIVMEQNSKLVSCFRLLISA